MAGDETRMDETRMAVVAVKAEIDVGRRRRVVRDVRRDAVVGVGVAADDELYDAALCFKCN